MELVSALAGQLLTPGRLGVEVVLTRLARQNLAIFRDPKTLSV